MRVSKDHFHCRPLKLNRLELVPFYRTLNVSVKERPIFKKMIEKNKLRREDAQSLIPP